MAKQKDRIKGLSIGKFSISTSKSKDMENGKKSKSLTVKVGDKTLYSRSKTKMADKISGVPTTAKADYFKQNRGEKAQLGDFKLFAKRSKTKQSQINVGVGGNRGSISISRLKGKYQDVGQDKPYFGGANYKEKVRTVTTKGSDGKGPSYDAKKKKGLMGYEYNVLGRRAKDTFVNASYGKEKQKGKKSKTK